jgi:quercetin dioxygenase-like cupin family protein
LSNIVCEDLNLAIDDLRNQGFRLDLIYPADDPHTAEMSRGGKGVRITTRPDAPGPSSGLPPFRPDFILTKGGASGAGRAGMNYRDLLPGRLGGRYIASHITIRDGGPVADWVHYHRIRWQMIYVHRGWVRVAYEDQGAPFVMEAGDLVLQPPEIRHQVLESSAGLEVIEIGCPALHATFADHEMALQTDKIDHDRNFSGQHFLHHIAKEAPWIPFGNGRVQETAMREATGGIAEVRLIRTNGPMEFAAHHGELVFGFVTAGSARLDFQEDHEIGLTDTFVIPPEEEWSIRSASADFRLLHVTTSRLRED